MKETSALALANRGSDRSAAWGSWQPPGWLRQLVDRAVAGRQVFAGSLMFNST